MPIIVKEPDLSTLYPPCPPGLHAAVCVDVVDLGIVKSEIYDDKWKVAFVFQVQELKQNGERFELSRRYNRSLGPKADLRRDLERWRGKPFTDDELGRSGGAGFDLDRVLGAQCQINVRHEERNHGGLMAKIDTIMPKADGAEDIHPLNYDRGVRFAGVGRFADDYDQAVEVAFLDARKGLYGTTSATLSMSGDADSLDEPPF